MAVASIAMLQEHYAQASQVPLFNSFAQVGSHYDMSKELDNLVHDFAQKADKKVKEPATMGLGLSSIFSSMMGGNEGDQDEGIVNTNTTMKTQRNGKKDREGQILMNG